MYQVHVMEPCVEFLFDEMKESEVVLICLEQHYRALTC